MDSTRLSLGPVQTMRTMADTRMALAHAMEAGAVEVDCSAVDEVDVTFIQLLLSTRRHAVERRRRLTMLIPGSSPLATALAGVGIDPARLSVPGTAPC